MANNLIVLSRILVGIFTTGHRNTIIVPYLHTARRKTIRVHMSSFASVGKSTIKDLGPDHLTSERLTPRNYSQEHPTLAIAL